MLSSAFRGKPTLGSGKSLAPASGGSSDPYWANVSLLLHFEGTDASTTFTDSSSHTRTFTVSGEAQIDTAHYVFGTASGLFDGTGDYIVDGTGADTDFAFGTGDFSIEFRARKTSNGTGSFGGYDIVAATASTTSCTGGWWVALNTVSGFAIENAGGTALAYADTGFATDGLFHTYEVSREGTALRLFIDGIVVASGTNGSSFSAGQALHVGICHSSDLAFNGHIDELRITKGVARNTSAYTPATAAFPNS